MQKTVESRNARANRLLKTFQEEAGIETYITLHLSRLLAAWKLHRKMDDVHKVKRILGHSRIEMTEEYLRGFPDP